MKGFLLNVVFVCSVFLLGVSPVCADKPDLSIPFQDAVSSYNRGEYQAAIQGFELLTGSGKSAPLFYNLANSYAQAGQSGRAILNYERALRLASGDSDIRGNLELVRRDKGLFQEEQSFVQRCITFLSLNQWVGLTATAAVLFAVVLLQPSVLRLKPSTRRGLAVCCLCVLTVAGIGAIGQYKHWHDGVVVVADARLRVSPFESAASIGTIQEGRLLHPGKVHNEYVLVVDEAGRSGWLAKKSYESIAIP